MQRRLLFGDRFDSIRDIADVSVSASVPIPYRYRYWYRKTAIAKPSVEKMVLKEGVILASTEDISGCVGSFPVAVSGMSDSIPGPGINKNLG